MLFLKINFPDHSGPACINELSSLLEHGAIQDGSADQCFSLVLKKINYLNALVLLQDV